MNILVVNGNNGDVGLFEAFHSRSLGLVRTWVWADLLPQGPEYTARRQKNQLPGVSKYLVHKYLLLCPIFQCT